jgi:hypothetical protein
LFGTTMPRFQHKLSPVAKVLACSLAVSCIALPSACLGVVGANDAPVAAVKVIASGLNQPKKITFAADGSLLVGLSGDGVAPSTCTDGDQASCVGRSGAIDEVSPSGKVSTLLSGLSSVSSGGTDAQATGPVEALAENDSLQVLFQGSVINAHTGREVYGAAGSELEKLLRLSAGSSSPALEADLGRFEARHHPDHGAGTEVRFGQSAIDSDPYAIVAYRGGYAIADAGANDLLFVSPSGKISVLAVFPTIKERAAAGAFGSKQKKAIEAEAQAVPDSLAVGPDGALYVGELGGIPDALGESDVYRVLPGHRPTVYASGLTGVDDIAFDSRGRLLVLEIDRKGLNDPGFNTGHPASGVLLRISPSGSRQTLLSKGLIYPTGIAVRGSTIYLSNYGVSSASVGRGGEIVRITLR